jgi:hypothetical protein
VFSDNDNDLAHNGEANTSFSQAGADLHAPPQEIRRDGVPNSYETPTARVAMKSSTEHQKTPNAQGSSEASYSCPSIVLM